MCVGDVPAAETAEFVESERITVREAAGRTRNMTANSRQKYMQKYEDKDKDEDKDD